MLNNVALDGYRHEFLEADMALDMNIKKKLNIVLIRSSRTEKSKHDFEQYCFQYVFV
jgi:hypothetical protein